MNLRRASLLTGLLGLLALLIAWSLRTPPNAAPRQLDVVVAAQPKSPPVLRDFPKRASPEDAVFANPPAEDGPERPHPWSAHLKLSAEIEAKLRGINVAVEWQDKNLNEIIREMESMFGMKLNLDCPAEVASKKLSFCVKDLAALHVLRLLTAQYDLIWVVGEDGEVWLVNHEPMGEPPAVIWPHEPSFMAAVRGMRSVAGEFAPPKPPDPGLVEGERSLVETLEKKRIDLQFTDTPMPEAVSFVQELTQTNIMIDRHFIDDLDSKMVTVSLSQATVGDALKTCLKQSELGYYTKDGVIVIVSQAHIDKMHEAERLAEEKRRAIAAAQADLFDNPVAFGVENMRLRDVCEVLAKGLGVPYEIDAATWDRRARYTIEARQRPAWDVITLLKRGAPLTVAYRNGVLWFLSPDGSK